MNFEQIEKIFLIKQKYKSELWRRALEKTCSIHRAEYRIYYTAVWEKYLTTSPLSPFQGHRAYKTY